MGSISKEEDADDGPIVNVVDDSRGREPVVAICSASLMARFVR